MDCPKRGYMSCHRNRFKSLADPFDWMAMHLMGEGNRFGQRAREYFPGGRLIEHVFDLDRARAETAAAMRDEAVTDIFEGAFATEGLLCRVDVCARSATDEVDLIEVKATSGVKSYHLPDVGFQLAVLEGSGISVRSSLSCTSIRSTSGRARTNTPSALFSRSTMLRRKRGNGWRRALPSVSSPCGWIWHGPNRRASR